ncbi:MAG: 1,4-dihydroxy-2-naphthoate octaprenyltransferase [Bacteroidales bacterium]|nr:1,4-dihydroxy-2-naphthoate octaprenyltransferase [Bacteroidales bacterium]
MKKWIEAMRLRTLPVSVAGVLAGIACAIMQGCFSVVPALLCLFFAILAQIASNFGNEYYDFKNGLDKKGREGFRRGVTEGDISPRAMRNATFGTLAAAAAAGCLMLLYGEWWLIPVGVCIVLFALAYSAGPYPLSHHGLGDLAVIIFFGMVPVTFTCLLQQGSWDGVEISLPISISVGFLADNVLIVNNYRDMDDDKAVGKRTTAVIFGRRTMGWCYLLSGVTAMAIAATVLWKVSPWFLMAVAVYLLMHISAWRSMVTRNGAALNPVLGRTAMNLLAFAIMLLFGAFISS